MENLSVKWFKKKVLELTELDLESYKNMQMDRRIDFIMKKKGVKTHVEYYKILKTDKNALEEFKNFITINVSTLFRDPEKWKELGEKYLPYLIKNKKIKYLKIWSAGCSNGAEVYSTIITLKELFKKGYPTSYEIIATDIDKNILEEAKKGIFTKREMVNVEDKFLKNYFTEIDNGLFKVKNDIKTAIDFKNYDILNEPVGSDFDLILCRNVLIYFTEDAQNKIYKKLADSLRDSGILFAGGTEIIFHHKKIGLKNLSMCFYQKHSITS